MTRRVHGLEEMRDGGRYLQQGKVRRNTSKSTYTVTAGDVWPI